MIHIKWPFIFLLALVFISCGDDEGTPSPGTPVNPTVPGIPNNPTGPDSISPGIQFFSPEANADLLLFDFIRVLAYITDNAGLKEVRLFIVDPKGVRSEVEGLHHLKSLNTSSTDLHLYMRLPKGSATGNYAVVMEAEDKQQNVTKDSVSFQVDAPDLTESRFIEAFIRNGFIGVLADWDERFLTQRSFITGFFYVMDRDNNFRVLRSEWERFADDFSIDKQGWPAWDVNSDGILTLDEFGIGLSGSKLFEEWDKDKDGRLSEAELASGVFSRWDSNGDGMLTRAEYEERLHTYFY